MARRSIAAPHGSRAPLSVPAGLLGSEPTGKSRRFPELIQLQAECAELGRHQVSARRTPEMGVQDQSAHSWAGHWVYGGCWVPPPASSPVGLPPYRNQLRCHRVPLPGRDLHRELEPLQSVH